MTTVPEVRALAKSLGCPDPRYVQATGRDQNVPTLNHEPQSQIRTTITPEEFFCLLQDQVRDIEPGFDVDRQGFSLDTFAKSTAFNPASHENLRHRFCQHLPVDSVWVTITIKTRPSTRGPGTFTTARVTGHEGRHRAYTAHELGLRNLPFLALLRKQAPGDRFAQPVNLNPDRPNARPWQPMLTREEAHQLQLLLLHCGITRTRSQVTTEDVHPQDRADPNG